jgi:Ca-activated chloride channel homolog
MPCRRPPAPRPRCEKKGEGYVLHTDVEEVVLNATVLDGNAAGPDLKRTISQVFEDGVKQTLISFQHTDLPVSIGLVVDNSGSMSASGPR